jgi:hypothetical protein
MILKMTRRLYTALAAAMLATASLQAPFAHVHPEDPEHHHAQGLAHTHLALHPHHEAEGPEIEKHDDDELTVYLDWAPAAAQRVVVAYVAGPPVPAVDTELAPIGAAPELTPRANSPPALRLLPARAPPV